MIYKPVCDNCSVVVAAGERFCTVSIMENDGSHYVVYCYCAPCMRTIAADRWLSPMANGDIKEMRFGWISVPAPTSSF